MNIEQKIKIDLKKSMIGQHKKRTSLLRTILGEFNRIGKDISDEKCLSIIKKMKENAEIMGNVEEIPILSEYLPKTLSQEETVKIVENIIKDGDYTIKDMGSIMKTLKSEYGASMDMKTASMTVKKVLI